ncbi:MAG: hypothetical protein QXM68_03340 [Candidatus Aenigmatarchaeota archaeon]|nr:hypothetical protein [Candidatus Aenigmarchaeota archaeon]
MKVYFLFKPCKTDSVFEIIPQKEISRKLLIKAIQKEFNGKIVTDSGFLTIIDINEGKISVTKNNKIILRGIKEERAKEIANRIMKYFFS